MNKVLKIGSVFIMFAVTACNSTTPIKTAPQAAILGEYSTQVRLVINATISEALNGTKVAVAKSAFVNSNKLTLQKAAQNSAGMKGINGRLLDRPTVYSFLMMKQGSDCFLVYEKTKKQYLLNGVSCRLI